ncbi:Glycoside hydrolase 2 (Mannanase, beta-galactosidase) [Elasticomyces elasticus]|nr:Glycoside hydrolase 2 (Mannanase, beta-galactosidase) [Elasticomyces elasticus]
MPLKRVKVRLLRLLHMFDIDFAQCDGARPACARCQRIGVACMGYRQDTDIFFTDQTRRTIERAMKASRKQINPKNGLPAVILTDRSQHQRQQSANSLCHRCASLGTLTSSAKTGTKKRRRLGEKEKVIYAPMSDVGGVLVDRDTVHIDVKSNTFDAEEDEEDGAERGLGEQMVGELQGGRRGGGQGYRPHFPPPSHRHHCCAEAELEDEGFGEDEGVEDGESDDDADLEVLQQAPEKLGRARKDRTVEGDVAFADSDSDLGSISEVSDQEFKEDSELKDNDETGGETGGEEGDEEMEEGDEVDEEMDSGTENEDEDGGRRWKDRMLEKAGDLQGKRQPYRVAELARMMYDDLLSTAQVLKRWKSEDDDKDAGAAITEDEDDDGDLSEEEGGCG